MSVLYAEKRPKKHSEHKPKKEKGVDEIDVGKVVIPNKAAVEDDGEQKLPQTPTTSMEKQQPPAPQKKVYPKEKHPKAAESPKFGQRLLAAPPGKEKPSVKPESLVKPSEQKRFETKPPAVAKPVEKVFSPHRKAPEPPVERASPKPKAKVITRAY